MFFGIRQLQRSAALLEAADGPADPAVPEAILSFLSAYGMCRRDWPEPFLDRAAEIGRLMTAGGPPAATAEALDATGLAELREKVAGFVVDAERYTPRPGRVRS